MKFIHTDLGQRKKGDVVEVTLSSGANVRLLDSHNLSAYRNNRPHKAVGGLATRSPVRFAVPSNGHWHVAVDMQGLALTVVGAIIALRREARAGRSTGGWMLSFFLLGPLAVAGYFVIHAGVQQAEVPTRQ